MKNHIPYTSIFSEDSPGAGFGGIGAGPQTSASLTSANTPENNGRTIRIGSVNKGQKQKRKKSDPKPSIL